MREWFDDLLDRITRRRTPGLSPRRPPLRERMGDRIADTGERWRDFKEEIGERRRIVIPGIVILALLFGGGLYFGNTIGSDASTVQKVTVKHFVTLPNPNGPGSVTVPVTKKVTKIRYKNKVITVRLKGSRAVISSPGTTITQRAPGRTVTDTTTDTKTDTQTSTQTRTETNTQTDTTTVIRTTTTTIPGTNQTITVTTTVTGPTQTVTSTEISGTTITVTVTTTQPPST